MRKEKEENQEIEDREEREKREKKKERKERGNICKNGDKRDSYEKGRKDRGEVVWIRLCRGNILNITLNITNNFKEHQ